MKLDIFGGLICCIIIALAGWYIADLRGQVAALKSAAVYAQADIKSCKASIDAQNTAIMQLQTDAATREKAAQASIKKSTETAKKWQERALQIENEQSTGDGCKDAENLLNQEIESRAKND
jgi:hypothetical protein